jgi:hypothetical protein
MRGPASSGTEAARLRIGRESEKHRRRIEEGEVLLHRML